jgi:hypothetical protein
MCNKRNVYNVPESTEQMTIGEGGFRLLPKTWYLSLKGQDPVHLHLKGWGCGGCLGNTL